MKKDNIRRNISLLMEHFEITSESQLARETGLGQATINKLISGSTEDPRLTTLIPIAERFNLTLDTLVSDNPNFSQNTTSKDNKHSSTFIPITSFEEMTDIFDSLNSLHPENWPYWMPVSIHSSYPCFAVKLIKNHFSEPFNKISTLICEQSPEPVNGMYCFVKHRDSGTISIMKILKEAGKTWLLSLKKELPAIQFDADTWIFLGSIRGMVVDVSDGNFFN